MSLEASSLPELKDYAIFLPDESQTFLFTFDSMVHFDAEVIDSYLSEFSRILCPGGAAFVHHSNYRENKGGDFRDNPHWRSYMTAELFEKLALQSGFDWIEQVMMNWGHAADLDCLSLIGKAKRL